MEIYLDNCATTRVCPEAAAACMEAMTGRYGNPSSLHRKGLEAETILTETRKTIGRMLSCPPECIYFTANATESNNLAILGSAAAHPKGGSTIVTTAVEHSSVAQSVSELERRGYTVRRVMPRPDGQFAAEDFLAAADSSTLLVSFMMVNNETGAILPYQKLIPALRRKFPKGIYVSSGSACSQGAQSPALAAFGLSPEQVDSALRVSFSRETTLPEIDALVDALEEGINRLRPIIEKNGKDRL